MNLENVVRLGEHFIVRISGKFFLLIKIEVDCANVKKEEIVFVPVSKTEADSLLDAGI